VSDFDLNAPGVNEKFFPRRLVFLFNKYLSKRIFLGVGLAIGSWQEQTSG
jgi:hypothetical protein